MYLDGSAKAEYNFQNDAGTTPVQIFQDKGTNQVLKTSDILRNESTTPI